MDNLSKEIFVPVFDEMRLAENEFCQRCNAAYKSPLLPWIVGAGYRNSKYRLMIVGKPHRGDAVPVSGHERHAFCMDYCLDKLIGYNFAYWSYSREIAQQLYGPTGIEQLALTNVVKCTNTEGSDQTTKEMLDNCIRDNGVIWREIQELEPLNIVFYTYNLCVGNLEHLPFQKELLEEDRKRVACGKKRMPWWERTVKADWGIVKILVTRHPQFTSKNDYVKSVVDWVQK